MALRSVVTWGPSEPNSKGYRSFGVKGEFTGFVSTNQVLRLGDVVEVGIRMNRPKGSKVTYTNYVVLRKIEPDESFLQGPDESGFVSVGDMPLPY